ncbi:hypothetical protein [Microbacterium sp. Leaf320]|uniref:hypothetical protein n=1 Tax=Microbacterium sp. Leaf320 TaxID=1736334 RepID=UPI0006F72EB1|nr:hypothetical protein [Microbacterium sp. Leaf320]KQQ65329.1 hypothetical protein ASF63_15420 [Microbacterium sp. Leaf320]
MAMNSWGRVHPAALERFRARVGRSAAVVVWDAGIDPGEFRARLAGPGFTPGQVAALAAALETTPREILSASKLQFTAESIRLPHILPWRHAS